MATTFGIDATSLSEPQGAGAQPRAGIHTPASQYTLPAGLMDVGVQVYSDLQEMKKNQAKEAAKKQQTELLSTYTRTRTNIADSNLPLQEKIARMNAIDSQFQIAATEMGAMEDFKKARDLLTSGGITGAVQSQEEIDRKDLENKITFLRNNNIYIPPGTDPVIVETLLQKHAQTEQALQQYEQSHTLLTRGRETVKYTQSQEDRMRQEKATESLNSMAGINIESFNIQAKLISDRVLSDTSYTEAQARVDLLELQNRYLAPITSMSAHHESLGATWRNMYEGIIKGHMDIITERGEAGQRTIDQITNQASLLAAQKNPELVAIASVRPWLGDNNLTAQIVTERTAARLIPDLVSEDFEAVGLKGTNIVANAGEKSAEVLTYAYIREGLAQSRSGVFPDSDKAKQDYFQATNNILTMLGDRNPGSLEAAELKEVSEFLLSPEFAYVVKEGGLNQGAASAAANVFKQVYGKAMDGAVKEVFQSTLPSGVMSQPDLKFSDAVDVIFQDGKVKFMPKPRIVDGEQGRAREVDRLIMSQSKEAEKAINRNLRIGAHLEGTTDYQKFWEDNKDILMPYIFSDPNVDIPNSFWDGKEWEYIGPKGGNTSDQRNWRPIDARKRD